MFLEQIQVSFINHSISFSLPEGTTSCQKDTSREDFWNVLKIHFFLAALFGKKGSTSGQLTKGKLSLPHYKPLNVVGKKLMHNISDYKKSQLFTNSLPYCTEVVLDSPFWVTIKWGHGSRGLCVLLPWAQPQSLHLRLPRLLLRWSVLEKSRENWSHHFTSAKVQGQ